MKDIIIELGKFIYARGWSPATGGNFSTRMADGNIAITASGRHKGELCEEDILTVNPNGLPVESQQKPSAETLLHVTIYALDKTAQVVLHTHSVSATVLSMQTSENYISFSGYEMLKGIHDVATHEAKTELTIFDNAQDMKILAKSLSENWGKTKNNYGFLVRGHGLYVWGKDADEARRHLEAWEFLLACALETRKIK